MESLNLCDYPWIPIAGEKERKTLMQIFSEPRLSQLSGNPVDKIVILRLLLCIVHASNPLPDTDAWDNLTLEQMAGNARAYLQKWHDRFDLYGEKPFLQFPKLAEIGGKIKKLAELGIGFSMNAPLLSNWDINRASKPDNLILALIRSACYLFGKNGNDKELILTKGFTKGKTGKAGTLLGKQGYLHCFIHGISLWETIKLNLLTEEDIHEIGIGELGIPFWEEMPEGELDRKAEKYRASYLGTLFPLDKFMLLQPPEGVIITDGIPYNGATDERALYTSNDPALAQAESGAIICASTQKAIWRELPSILAILNVGLHRRPYFLYYGVQKVTSDTLFRIWCGGIEVSNDNGNNSLKLKNTFIESTFWYPRGTDQSEQYRYFCNLMKHLEIDGKILRDSVSQYWEEMYKGRDDKLNSSSSKAQKGCNEKPKKKNEESKRSGIAESLFWDQLESHAQTILDLAFSECDEEKIKQEKSSWFRILCQIYNDLCPHETPRQIEAWIKAHPGYNKNNKGNKRRKNESGKQI